MVFTSCYTAIFFGYRLLTHGAVTMATGTSSGRGGGGVISDENIGGWLGIGVHGVWRGRTGCHRLCSYNQVKTIALAEHVSWPKEVSV